MIQRSLCKYYQVYKHYSITTHNIQDCHKTSYLHWNKNKRFFFLFLCFRSVAMVIKLCFYSEDFNSLQRLVFFTCVVCFFPNSIKIRVLLYHFFLFFRVHMIFSNDLTKSWSIKNGHTMTAVLFNLFNFFAYYCTFKEKWKVTWHDPVGDVIRG